MAKFQFLMKNKAASRKKSATEIREIRNPQKTSEYSVPAFRKDDSFLLRLLESLEDYAVFTTDTVGVINSWNSGAAHLLGYQENEILGKNASILFTPEDRRKKTHEKELLTAAQKGRALDERYHVKKNKEVFWVSGMVFPLKDKNGQLIGFTKVMRDLTERRWGMNLVKHSEERYRAFIMNSTEGIWRFELEKPLKTTMPHNKQIDHFYEHAYLAECNDVVARMYGYNKAEEITGMRLGDFLPRENKQNNRYLLAFIQSGYRLAEVESQEKDKDNNDKFFLNNLVGSVENGYLIRAWGTQRDITDQKSIELYLKNMADIVEYSDDSIIRRTLDGKVLSWNKGAEKMYGYTASEMLGNDVKRTIPDEYKHEAEEISHKIMRGEHIQHFEAIRQRRDGSYFDISLSVSAIKDVSGNIIGISTIARDITDRKKLQQQKDEFIGIASHELKTPITSIKAYAQVIQNRFTKKGDSASAELMNKMNSQLDKLTDLINDLLDVTKIESGKLAFSSGYYDVNKLVEDEIEELQRTTTKHKIIFKRTKLPRIYGDRDRIGQVITNLISNAIKYSPQADRIVITTSKENSQVKICVQDFGVGIAKNKQGEIFERFFRVSGPDNTTFPGMGLGLYISSEIIKRQGGRIWVESRKGSGSTFCITLPLRKRKLPTSQNNG